MKWISEAINSCLTLLLLIPAVLTMVLMKFIPPVKREKKDEE